MRSIAATALAVALLATAVPLCASAQPAPAPSAEPAPVATPSAAPAPPAAAPLPSPAPTATASVSPYKFVVTPPLPAPGRPAIVEIDMLDSTLHAGQPYSVRVHTSLDVCTINLSTMGTTYGLQQAAPGLYASDGQVPSGIPFFLLNRDYVITVSALTKDGRSTSVPVTLHLAR